MNDNNSGALLRFTLIFSIIFILFSMRQNSVPLKSLVGCEDSLKKIGVQLEYWARENDGHYPEALTELTPPLPECPGAPSPTSKAFIDGYETTADRTGYRLVCKGHRHQEAKIPPDYPRIHSPNLENGFSAETKPQGQETPQAEPQSVEPEEAKPEKVESEKEEPQEQKEPQAEVTPEGSGTPDPNRTP